jgi:CheY-like chemotaxis protein
MALMHRPEIVLIDIGLAGMDGFEVARRMRLKLSLQATTRLPATARERRRGGGRDERRDASKHRIEKIGEAAAIKPPTAAPRKTSRALG